MIWSFHYDQMPQSLKIVQEIYRPIIVGDDWSKLYYNFILPSPQYCLHLPTTYPCRLVRWLFEDLLRPYFILDLYSFSCRDMVLGNSLLCVGCLLLLHSHWKIWGTSWYNHGITCDFWPWLSRGVKTAESLIIFMVETWKCATMSCSVCFSWLLRILVIACSLL